MSSISGINSSAAWPVPASNRPSPADMFAKVDTDGDGSVDVDELSSLLSDVSQKTGATFSADAQTLLKQMDADGDGKLSQDELDAGMKSILPPPEMRGGPPPEATASAGASAVAGSGGGGGGGSGGVQTYDPLDTNQDGVVSAAERMAGGVSADPLKALIESADSDGDGNISSSEMDAFVDKLSTALKTQGSDDSVSGTSNVSSSDTSSNAARFDEALGRIAEMVRQEYAKFSAEGVSQNASGASSTSAVNTFA